MSADPVAAQPAATVWTTPAGAPERLVWSGRRLVVIAKPIAWMDRTSWWESPVRTAAGQAAQVVERPMWQVTAKALDNGELLILDLAPSSSPQWPVTAIYD